MVFVIGLNYVLKTRDSLSSKIKKDFPLSEGEATAKNSRRGLDIEGMATVNPLRKFPPCEE